jgi:transposase
VVLDVPGSVSTCTWSTRRSRRHAPYAASWQASTTGSRSGAGGIWTRCSSSQRYTPAPPRASCPRHGVKVIELPWASKSSRFTLLFEAFAVDVLKAAKSIKDAQGTLRLSWHQTQQIMAAAVRRGMARRDADEVSFVGMDEKSFRHGRKADDFACVMTDIDGRRILDVGRGRGEEGARQLIERALNPVRRHLARGAAIDMSAPFEKAIRELLPCADVVFDKFHVGKHLNKGVDNTRKQENGRMLKRNDKRLARTKYIWLKGFEHLSDAEDAKRRDVMRAALQTGKAWGFKEMFGSFWKSVDKRFAQANFTFWHEQVVKSGIRPMIKVAKTLFVLDTNNRCMIYYAA